MGQRYCRMEDQKPWLGLALNQDKRAKIKSLKAKISKVGDVLSKLT